MPEGLNIKNAVNIAKETISVRLGDMINPVKVSIHARKNAAKMLPVTLPIPPITTITKAFISGISHM